MKTTDFTLAEIDDYIAVRKLVTRKAIRLAHEYEKTLEWRHMEKLHDTGEQLSNKRERQFHEYNRISAKINIGCKPCAKSTRGWQNIEHKHIILDDNLLPCVVNGIEIPKHLRRTLDLILSHGKNKQVSISLIMCAKGVCFKTAESKYYYDLKALSKLLRTKNKKSSPKVQGK